MSYIIKYNSSSEECDNFKEVNTYPVSIDVNSNETVVIDLMYFGVPTIQVNCSSDNDTYEMFTYIMKEKNDQNYIIRCNKQKDQVNNADYFKGTNQIYFQVAGIRGIVFKNTSLSKVNVQIVN